MSASSTAQKDQKLCRWKHQRSPANEERAVTGDGIFIGLGSDIRVSVCRKLQSEKLGTPQIIKSAKHKCALISNATSYQSAPETFANIVLIILITSPPGVKGCGWKKAVLAGSQDNLLRALQQDQKNASVLPDGKKSSFVNYVFYSKFLLSLSFQYVITNRECRMQIYINICMCVYRFVFLMIRVTEVKAMSPFITFPSSLVIRIAFPRE